MFCARPVTPMTTIRYGLLSVAFIKLSFVSCPSSMRLSYVFALTIKALKVSKTILLLVALLFSHNIKTFDDLFSSENYI